MTFHVWHAISGAEVSEMRGHEGGVVSVDGHRVVSGSIDKSIRVWNTITGDEVMPPLRGHEDYVESVTFSPDGTMLSRFHHGRRIVSGSWDFTAPVWDVTTGAQVFPVMREHTIGRSIMVATSVFFSPDASRIISQSRYESLSWDAATGLRVSANEQSDHRL
ncbi:hypothetical protein PILCRDRAFT_17357 [Piloderma croceum F 1598]|uniref:Uncharacterized protein n=1 Tax=Piloderma croceum (strain F 1598) TaxID=765440 RepID=A0A0C3B1M4_PILCF|nr:hypothetical protein PILCRDRAFT_17357 [Piloderma croceum F 1598]